MNDEVRTALLALLGFARRSGLLIIGQDSVKSSMTRGAELLVLFAGESSSFTRSIQRKNTEKCSLVFCPPEISRDALSQAIGSKNVKVVALPLRSGFAQRISQLLAEGGISIE